MTSLKTSTNFADPREDGKDHPPKGIWWRQHLAACLASMSSMCTGMGVGWSAPVQALLRGDIPESPLRLTLEQRSWVNSLFPMGELLFAPFSGLLVECIGRKWALLYGCSIPGVVGWLLLLFAEQRVWMMYVGRLLIGIASGASSVPVSLYCEEIATVQIRGKIGTYLDLLITIGLLYAYTLGAVLPYFWFTAMGLVPVVVFTLGFCWMPESPAYLIACGREEEALKVLSWLRGPAIDVRHEFDEIKRAFKTKETRNDEGCFTLPKIDKVTAKAVLIVIGIMFLTQTTGLHGFLYYSTDVFREVGSSISADLSTIIVGSMHVVGAVIVLLSVDRLGRRPMLLGASFFMGLCLSALSLYSYMQDHGDVGVGLWRWIPLITLLVYYFLFSLGPGPLSWFMMAEILPPNVKGWGSALGVCVTRGVSFLITKEFEDASEAWGQGVICSTFSILCFVFTAFIWIFVPETRGRKRHEIQESLRSPVFKRCHLPGVTLKSVRRVSV